MVRVAKIPNDQVGFGEGLAGREREGETSPFVVEKLWYIALKNDLHPPVRSQRSLRLSHPILFSDVLVPDLPEIKIPG